MFGEGFYNFDLKITEFNKELLGNVDEWLEWMKQNKVGSVKFNSDGTITCRPSRN